MDTFSILTVDDEIKNLNVILEYLREAKESFRVFQESGGEEACKTAKLQNPDVIVLDLEMPQMNGLETLLRLKSMPETRNIPVIMIAPQQGMTEELEKALNTGAEDYIHKPIKKIELLTRIRTITELSSAYERINYRELEIESQSRKLEEFREKFIAKDEEVEGKKSQLNNQTKRLQESYLRLDTMLKKLKNTQLKLVQAEKMASLGQLTAGIINEINDPVNNIFAGTDSLEINFQEILFLLKKYENLNAENVSETLSEIETFKEQSAYDDLLKEIYSLLSDVRSGAERTAAIISGLKNFSRLDEKELKPSDIHDGLDSAWMLLKSSLKKDIKLIKNYDRTIGNIPAHHGELNQVFMNIMNNAVQAIEKQGVIKIVTQGFEDYISISIEDNGYGIKNENQDKIFDPFFTTQEAGDGRGLGLSVAHTIVDKHNGMIKVHSTENEGSNFVITLPRP